MSLRTSLKRPEARRGPNANAQPRRRIASTASCPTAAKTAAATVVLALVVAGMSGCGSESGTSTTTKPSTGATSVVKKEAGAADEVPTFEGQAPTFDDEFNGPANAPPDPAKWTPKIGPLDSNNELQYYTDNKNAALDGNGNLVLTARKEDTPLADTSCRVSTRSNNFSPCVYTSARLSTKQACPVDKRNTQPNGAQKCAVDDIGYNFSQRGGRFEARVKLPEGDGLVPAFWLLGANERKWPGQGEIDIFEAPKLPRVGTRPYSFIKSHNWFPAASDSDDIKKVWNNIKDYTGQFHTYTFDQDPNKGVMTWYVDGQKTWEQTRAQAPNEEAAAIFDQAWYPILNIAVGGNWPGDPTAPFPRTMTVDWVRVYPKPQSEPGGPASNAQPNSAEREAQPDATPAGP
jgi:beta-glucanase (GH16 family)